MQRHIALIHLVSSSLLLAVPPAEDRHAILAMAGNFKVVFDFEETCVIVSDYQFLSKPYHEEAIEVVTVAEDTPERITLQHLLVVGESGNSKVIKHWAQVWTWQDNRILDYAGSDGIDTWLRHIVPQERVTGKWSQLVTSVDDTPRYEGLGTWVHQFGESSWTSEPTRRPMPRREYEVRDDYDYLLVINRHTLTPSGWIHFQDNRKVVDRKQKKMIVAHETGLNRYTRTDDPLGGKAREWWQGHAVVWNTIRNFWIDAGQQDGTEFAYVTTHGGMGLSKKFEELEKSNPTPETISQALRPYLSTTR